MKKIIFASAALVGVVGAMDASAAAVSVCAGSGTATAVTGTAGQFVITTFTPKCSANTNVIGNDHTSYYAVGANSVKGKNSFKGSTAGGGVVPHTTCANAGACTAAEATAAEVAAPSS